MKEIMQGTCLYNDVAVAKKVGQGRKVNSRSGKPFESVRFGAKPGEMSNVKFVKTKKDARNLLKELENETYSKA